MKLAVPRAARCPSVGSHFKLWEAIITSRNERSYRDAGVDIDAGNALVEAIKPLAAATARPGSDAGLGGFGAFFDPRAAGYLDPLLVAATDLMSRGGPPSTPLGSFFVTAPLVPGDYLMTVNNVVGAHSDTTIGNGSGRSLPVDDFGDLIIRARRAAALATAISAGPPAGVQVMDNGHSGFSWIGSFHDLAAYGLGGNSLPGNVINGNESAEWRLENRAAVSILEVSTVVDPRRDADGSVIDGRGFEVLDSVTSVTIVAGALRNLVETVETVSVGL